MLTRGERVTSRWRREPAHRCWARPLPASSGKLWSGGTGSPALASAGRSEADATRLQEAVLTPATRGNGRDGELAVNDTALPFSAQGRVVDSPGRGDHPGHATPTTTTACTLMAAAPDVALATTTALLAGAVLYGAYG
jgi:hypothetical protein